MLRRLLALMALCLLPLPAQAQVREITVVTPAFVWNSGLDVFGPAFTAQTGIKVNLQVISMDRVVERAVKGDPADLVFMPPALMAEVEKAGGVRAGSRRKIGRSFIGLAVRKGDKVPDISTVPKLVAALESANLVLHSNPSTGSMSAKMISDMLARPEFARVRRQPSPYGEGGAALARNEGDMAIQNICQILLWSNLQVVGPLPEELGMHMDAVGAVSSRSANPEAARQFLDYITQPGTFPLWFSRGLDPRKG
jgi:ABC-type molybdate transport system substrate-binding protein